jgi:anti-sigma factor RsiW
VKLDSSTYEAWLLDRIEGRLTPDQERELDAFLAANPELAVDAGELPTLDEATQAITWKEELKKNYPPQGLPDAPRLNDFLVARLERELTNEQEQALDRFLYEHPEATRDAQLMARAKADAALIAFDRKASMHRNFPPLGLPDEHRLNDFLIADVEGELSAEQHTALAAFLRANASAQREARLVKAARVSNERIVFANKEQLKKREARVIPLWTRLAAAASIALVAGAAWWLLKEQNGEPANVAVQKEATTPALPAPSWTEKEEVRGAANVEIAPTKGADTEEQVSPSDPAKSTPKPKETVPVPQRPVPARPDPIDPAQLAQDPVVVPTPSEEPAVAQVEITPPASAITASATMPAQQGSTDLTTLLANTVREGVLDTPDRNAGLDADDAVAAVDNGLSRITGGAAGVEVSRTAKRERLHLRFGQGFSLTASRGR